MAGKAHQMWRTNCDCGNCSFCNGISYPSGGLTLAQRVKATQAAEKMEKTEAHKATEHNNSTLAQGALNV